MDPFDEDEDGDVPKTLQEMEQDLDQILFADEEQELWAIRMLISMAELESSLSDTVQRLVDDRPQDFDSPDPFNHPLYLLSLDSFIQFVLVPHVAARIIEQDMDVPYMDAVDIKDESAEYGEMFQENEEIEATYPLRSGRCGSGVLVGIPPIGHHNSNSNTAGTGKSVLSSSYDQALDLRKLEKPLPPLPRIEKPPSSAHVLSDIDGDFEAWWIRFEVEWRNNAIIINAAGTAQERRNLCEVPDVPSRPNPSPKANIVSGSFYSFSDSNSAPPLGRRLGLDGHSGRKQEIKADIFKVLSIEVLTCGTKFDVTPRRRALRALASGSAAPEGSESAVSVRNWDKAVSDRCGEDTGAYILSSLIARQVTRTSWLNTFLLYSHISPGSNERRTMTSQLGAWPPLLGGSWFSCSPSILMGRFSITTRETAQQVCIVNEAAVSPVYQLVLIFSRNPIPAALLCEWATAKNLKSSFTKPLAGDNADGSDDEASLSEIERLADEDADMTPSPERIPPLNKRLKAGGAAVPLRVYKTLCGYSLATVATWQVATSVWVVDTRNQLNILGASETFFGKPGGEGGDADARVLGCW
ncbi:hypothetical protein B0H13DRAFT_1859362 [Mycena leptocephala]|nr:hypothetical protein B0H13DRAFT_1859362 [Mycena leptocephala]